MHARRPLAALVAAATFSAIVLAGTAFSEGDVGPVTSARLKQVPAPSRLGPAAVRAREEARTRARAERLAAQRADLEAAIAAKEAADREAFLGALAVRAARTAPRPRPVPGQLAAEWMSLLARYPWDVAVAARILWCESKGDPNARNGRHVGLFQIAHGPLDPAENVALAYRMYAARGWRPWYASRTCWS